MNESHDKGPIPFFKMPGESRPGNSKDCSGWSLVLRCPGLVHPSTPQVALSDTTSLSIHLRSDTPTGQRASLLAPFPVRPLTLHLWFLLTRILSAICWICSDFVWMSSFSLFSLRSMVSSLFTLFSREWRRSCGS